MRDEKKCHALRFFDVILFSTWLKNSTWSESMHKWPIIDHLIWLTWNRSVWPYKWGWHFGHSYSRRILPVLHHEINNVCRTVEKISCNGGKWGSEFSAGDQVLHGYYYEQEGNDFLHQRLVKKNSAGQKCNLHL